MDLATLQLRTLALPQTECLNAHELRVLSGAVAVAAWAVRGSLEVGIFPDAVITLPSLP